MSNNSTLFDDLELQALYRLGVAVDVLKKYQVLCLPENIRESLDSSGLLDAGHSLRLAKLLREVGVETATSYDFFPEAKTIERRGDDLWLGIIWVLENFSFPLVVSVFSSMLTANYSSQNESPATKSDQTVHIKLRIKRSGNFAKIDYSGDGKTLLAVLEALKSKKGQQ